MHKMGITMLLYWCECWKLKKEQKRNNGYGTHVLYSSGGGYRISDHKGNEDIEE
jgi:hypothetical protein